MKSRVLFFCCIFFIFGTLSAQVDPNSATDPSGKEPIENMNDIPPSGFQMVEKEPVPLNLNELKQLIGYPREAVRDSIEGKVVIRLKIDEQGKVIDHETLKNPHEILTNAVVAKIYALRFSPGILDSKPIVVWVTIPFDFKLN